MSKSQNRSITIAFTFVFAIVISFITLSCVANVNANALGIKVDRSVSVANKGDTVTISATGSNGSNLTYQFEVKSPGATSWKKIQNYSTSNKVNYTVNGAGTYQFRGTVKDSSSPPASVEAIVEITVYDFVNNSSVNSSKVNTGDSITVNGNASGGSGHYTYKYTYSKPNETKKYFITGNNTNPFIDASSVSFMLSDIGRYTIYVTAKDTATGSTKEKSFYVDVTQNTSKITNTSTASSKSTLYKGDTFVVAASASGGSGEYQYQYQIKTVDGTVVRTDAYSSKETFSYKANNVLGQFILTVTARDKKNTSNFASKQFTFEIKDKEYDSIVVSGTIDRTEILTPNNSMGKDTFTLNLSASGGTGTGYHYSYSYKQGNGEATIFGKDSSVSESNGAMDSSSFTGQFKKTGTYTVLVNVMDSRKTVYGTKVFTVTVKQAPMYNKDNLDALLSQVNNWYDNLTRTQKTQFQALKPDDGTSKDGFDYDKWKKAKDDAQNFYETGNEIDTDKYYNALKAQDELARQQELPSVEESEMFYGVNETMSVVMKFLLKGIGDMMVQNFGTTGPEDATIKGFDIQSFVDTFSPIFMIFANSLLVVLFGVNVLGTTLQYELFTLRGGAKLIGRLLLSKVFIDLSCTICMSLIKIAAALLTEVIGKSQNVLYDVGFHFTFMYSSGIPVVGDVIDFIVAAIVIVILFFMFIPLLYFMIKIIIKLFIINFELAGLTAMSPAFFACLSGEETKQYFKNFIVTFLQILGELIFMGIVYAAFIMWYNTVGDLSQTADISDMNIGGSIGNLIIFGIVFIAAAHLMIKPPEVFKNLIK